MAAVSFVEKFKKSGAVPIHLVRCKNAAGRDCYFFLMCSQQKIKTLKAVMDGIFNLKDYGEIIASGFGHTPSETIRKKLKDEYNFDANEVI